MCQVHKDYQYEVSNQFCFGIWHRVIFLSQQITYYHHKQVTRESSNGSAEVMIFWYQDYIESNSDQCPGNGDDGAQHILMFQFVPDAEIIINAQENIS